RPAPTPRRGTRPAGARRWSPTGPPPTTSARGPSRRRQRPRKPPSHPDGTVGRCRDVRTQGGLMPEAVIVATSRTPIGRANKGSLVDARPDDLTTFILKDVLAKVPALDPTEVEDVLLGCGQPAGEAGYNLARVAAVMAGLDDVPGVTVNRYCSSSLQTIRMAAHAIKAGEGDVFIAAGVETVSRYGNGMADGGPVNSLFKDAMAH